MKNHKRSKDFITNLLYEHMLIPFFSSFGAGLILYGAIRSYSSPDKLHAIPLGAIILVGVWLLVKYRKASNHSPRKRK
jgi:hypothetical protein